jgi:hypothetical protein
LVKACNAIASSTSIFISLLTGICLTINSLHQLTNLQAGSHLAPTSSSSCSCFTLYGPGMDCVQNATSQLFHCCVANLLPRNGCVCRAVS